MAKKNLLTKLKKSYKKKQKKISKLFLQKRIWLRGIFLLFGIFLLSLALYRFISESRVQNASIITETQKKEMSIPKKITITSVSIDTQIEPATIIDTNWQVSDNSASYLISSSPLNEKGNTIIYGHNKDNIFGRLPQIVKGDKIVIQDNLKKNHEYLTIGTFIVEADDLSFVQEEKNAVLTLYTCIGFLDSQRFVVRAIPLNKL